MGYKIYVAILLFLLRIGLYQTAENFGPYKWNCSKYETCNGPKKGECGTVRVENTHNMSDLIYILKIAQDCPVTKAKVTISTLQNNGKVASILWNYRLDNPCQHFVLGPILVNSLKLNNRCKISKGQYEVHLNMTEASRKFLGSNFYYGNYLFKITAFNNKNNFFCHLATIVISKI